jgi:hypothetical protein
VLYRMILQRCPQQILVSRQSPVEFAGKYFGCTVKPFLYAPGFQLVFLAKHSPT